MCFARAPISARSTAISVASIFILYSHLTLTDRAARTPPIEFGFGARIFLEGPCHCQIPAVPSDRDEPAAAHHAVAEQGLGLQALPAAVPLLGHRPAAGAAVAGGQQGHARPPGTRAPHGAALGGAHADDGAGAAGGGPGRTGRRS